VHATEYAAAHLEQKSNRGEGSDISCIPMKSAFCLLLLLGWLPAMMPTVCTEPCNARPTRNSSRLYQVSSRDKRSGRKTFGFIDDTGKLVIGFDRLPEETIAVGEFHEGLAVIYVKKKDSDERSGYRNQVAGYIDRTGAVVIATRFDSARAFSEGLAYVELDAMGFKGFIDVRGETVIKLEDPVAKDFHEGLAAVGTSEGGVGRNWGYINQSGTVVVKRQYSFADDFSEGLAGVAIDGKYGFIDKAGRMVIPARFGLRRELRHPGSIISSGRFSEGLACVSTGYRPNELYGFINNKGDFVIPPHFHAAQDFAEGLAFAVEMDKVTKVVKRVGWIDKFGRWAVTEVKKFVSSSDFPKTFNDPNGLLDWRYSEGLVPFFLYRGDRPLWGYMDQKGKVVIEPREFNRVGPFVGGVAWVEIRDFGMQQDWGYTDRQGRFIWRSEPLK